jgi:SpoVK/Ycf46/Vps4 family AAA+-type ATPase
VMKESCRNTVDKFRAQIKLRVPECYKLAQMEIVELHKKHQVLKEKKKLASYVLTTQDIITKFDDIMLTQHMSDNLRAQLATEEEDYTDDSEMEDEPGQRNTKKQKKKMGSAVRRENIDTRTVPEPEKFRPKRPRVNSIWFNRMMCQRQKWDKMKYLVNREQLNVKWTDVIGYYDTKKYLSNTFVHEVERRAKELDKTRGIAPVKWSGVNCLLYGPPGTGKTQLADAVATEAVSNIFIRAPSSAIFSKYVGQSEQNLKLLFQMANDLGPSIIFMDECEAILCNRAKSNSQSMTNIASALLNLMSVYPKVSLIATTNLPWMIDPAFARRFNTRLLLDLPNKRDREVMIKYCLRNSFSNLQDRDYAELAVLTEGFSGDDLANLALKVFAKEQEVVIDATYFKMCGYRRDKIIPTDASDPDPKKVERSYHEFRAFDIDPPILKVQFVKEVLQTMKPSVNSKVVEELREFHKTNLDQPKTSQCQYNGPCTNNLLFSYEKNLGK